MRTPVLQLLFLFSLFSSIACADELTDQAQQLLTENKAAEAYALLIPQLEQRAGDPVYDLLLGIAAVDSGQPTQAVFALERVLAIEPDNQRARLELARAYFEAGENEASREEFTLVKSRETSADVTRTIETYLTEIDTRISGKDSSLSFYVEATGGYDSNVNSATDTSTVAIPAFGNLVFTLDDVARELDSGFYQLDAGLGFTNGLAAYENTGVFGSIKGSYRQPWQQQDFDTATADAQLGLRFGNGEDAYTASLLGQTYAIDNDINRNQAGINLQWLHMRDQATQLSLFGQALVQRFPGQETRNVNQYTLGAGIVHLINDTGAPVVYAGLYAGLDDEKDSLYEYIGRNFIGVRAGGQYTLREDLNLVGGASYQYSRYGAVEPLFLEKRKDHFAHIHAGLEYTVMKSWVIKPDVQYLLNKSNLPINDFRRWQAMISVRYNFL